MKKRDARRNFGRTEKADPGKARFEVASEMGISYSALTAYELGERIQRMPRRLRSHVTTTRPSKDLFYPQMEASDANG